MPWRLLEHTADLAVEVTASGWKELLEEAVAAFRGVVAETALAPGTTERRLQVQGEHVVETWVRWWRALLRLWTVEELLAVEAAIVQAEPGCGMGRVRCLPASALELAACTEVKAVTWHGASAAPLADGTGWSGRIILDV